MKHFKALHARTGIPYSEMLFFDDEHRNVEVEKLGGFQIFKVLIILLKCNLGVTFILASKGLDWKTFESGLKEWRKRKANAYEPLTAT